jgi:prefoldin subunit 5
MKRSNFMELEKDEAEPVIKEPENKLEESIQAMEQIIEQVNIPVDTNYDLSSYNNIIFTC